MKLSWGLEVTSVGSSVGTSVGAEGESPRAKLIGELMSEPMHFSGNENDKKSGRKLQRCPCHVVWKIFITHKKDPIGIEETSIPRFVFFTTDVLFDVFFGFEDVE